MTEAIPVVDVSPWLAELDAAGPEAWRARRRNVAVQIREALTTVGFFALCGWEAYVCDPRRVLDVSRAFFALDSEQKRQVALNRHFRGYSGLGSEVTLGQRDVHECYDIVPEMKDDGRPLHGPNVWPATPNELQSVCGQYYADMNRLGRHVMDAVAEGLGIPPAEWMDDRPGEPPFSLLRLLHYPACANVDDTDDAGLARLPVGIGVGRHTDYGFLTMIYTNAAGLQVETRAGAWIDAPVDARYLVCNVGDALSGMTGGLLRATPHRVLIPQVDRTSAAFFYEPRYDAMVRTVASLADDTRPPREAYHYGTYLLHRYQASYP